MAAPYSDNMYSADLSDDEPDALSPSDGYFHASSSSELTSAPQQQQPFDEGPASSSSNVPSVPNVLVEDPTLREQSVDKAREAAQERLNSAEYQDSAPELRTQPSQPPFSPVRYHRRSVDEDDAQFHPVDHTPSPRTQPTRVETNPLLQHQQHRTQRQPYQQQSRRPADAPPAYSPPISPIANNSAGYQTFVPVLPSMGAPEEQQHLLAREPQSMGDPPHQPKRNPWQGFTERLRVTNIRKKIKTVLGTLIILSIFLMVLSGFTLKTSHNDDNLGSDVPIREPDGSNPPDFRWAPSNQCLNEPHVFDTVITNFEAHHERNLSVIHKLSKETGRNGWSPHVYGQVILIPTQDSSPASITLEVISNDKNLKVDLDFDENEQTYLLSTPDRISWHQAQLAPCIQIRATVAIPREAWLKNLKIDTVQLGIEIKDGLVVGVAGGSSLSTLSGDIKTPTSQDADIEDPYLFGSRDIVIKTVSGNVHGWLPLYDLLRINTASGDIKVDIGPKKVDPAEAKSAVLDVKTISGYVKLSEPIDHAIASEKPDKLFPPRDYIVKVATASGDIAAQLAVSSVTNFQSQSGDFQLRLWPILDSALLAQHAPTPDLTTDTKSGETSLILLEPRWTSISKIGKSTSGAAPGKSWPPAWDGGKDFSPIEGHDPFLIIHPEGVSGSDSDEDTQKTPSTSGLSDKATTADNVALSSLKSHHTSISGNMKLTYPGSWEGFLWAHTISGSQEIHGEGLELNRSGGSFMRQIQGRKGKGTSEFKIETVSGDQTVTIG